MRQLPALANWLLQNFVSREALAGDLAEEYAAGRSHTWCLKQVFLAVVVDAWSEIRTHKLLTSRAIAVGVTFLIAWITAFHYSTWWTTLAASPDKTSSVAFWAIPFAGYFASGWLVGLFHRPSMVFAFLMALLVLCAIGDWPVVSSWFPRIVSPMASFGALAIAGISSSVFVRSLVSRPRRVPPSDRVRRATSATQ